MAEHVSHTMNAWRCTIALLHRNSTKGMHRHVPPADAHAPLLMCRASWWLNP